MNLKSFNLFFIDSPLIKISSQNGNSIEISICNLLHISEIAFSGTPFLYFSSYSSNDFKIN
jgi:hypothetical protein